MVKGVVMGSASGVGGVVRSVARGVVRDAVCHIRT